MGAISRCIASVISWHYEHKARIKYRFSLISEDADDEEEFAEIYGGWTSTLLEIYLFYNERLAHHLFLI